MMSVAVMVVEDHVCKPALIFLAPTFVPVFLDTFCTLTTTHAMVSPTMVPHFYLQCLALNYDTPKIPKQLR